MMARSTGAAKSPKKRSAGMDVHGVMKPSSLCSSRAFSSSSRSRMGRHSSRTWFPTNVGTAFTTATPVPATSLGTRYGR